MLQHSFGSVAQLPRSLSHSLLMNACAGDLVPSTEDTNQTKQDRTKNSKDHLKVTNTEHTDVQLESNCMCIEFI